MGIVVQREIWTSDIPHPELWALVLDEVGKALVKIETVSKRGARVRYFPNESEPATRIGQFLESRHSTELVWAELRVRSHGNGTSLEFRLLLTRGACFALFVMAALALGGLIIVFIDALGNGSIIRRCVGFASVVLLLGFEFLLFRGSLRNISGSTRILREPFERIVSSGEARRSMTSS